MNKLFNGILKFRENDYESHKDIFKKLARGQEPHTLFIGCSDSRVVPTLITKSFPGELFMIRNIANVVPPYDKKDQWVSTTAAIEYAVKVLKVENIVICGHSNCGGCAAMYSKDEKLKELDFYRPWQSVSEEVNKQVNEVITSDSPEEREWLTEQVNVLVQKNNLLTYPYIKEAVENNKLKLFGWHYLIETGEIFNFNDENKEFELIS
jgi:carbonic anhydrase